MGLSGGELAGVIGGGVLLGATLIALVCCICSYFPSVNQKFLLLCCQCRFGKLFHKKRLPFSAQLVTSLQKPVKVSPLESVLVVHPATLLPPPYEKYDIFSGETARGSFAPPYHKNTIQQIITIPGSIPQEVKEDENVVKENLQIDTKVEIEPEEESDEVLTPQQLPKTPQLPETPELESETPSVLEVETNQEPLKQETINSEPLDTIYPESPPSLDTPKFPISTDSVLLLEEEDPLEIEIEEQEKEDDQENEKEILTDEESVHSELDFEDDILQEEEDLVQDDHVVQGKEEGTQPVVVEPVTWKEEIIKSPSQSSQRSNKSIQSVSNYEGIILGVDATTKRNGGYLIVPNSDLCEFYSADTRFLPWRLNNVTKRGNSGDFEMKNVMFALLNWEDVIISVGSLWVYTDNMAIIDKGIGSRQGINVRAFLRHLNKCQKVKIMNNKNHYVHTFKNPKTFTKYILPADHLSRKKIFDFHNHIEEHFNITNIREGFYATKVEEQITKWIQGRCKQCGFQLRISNSLRDNIKSRMSTIRFVNAFPHNY